jgi:hypothetical protein
MAWLSRMLLGTPLTAAGIVPELDLARLTICGLGSTSTRVEIEKRLGPAGDYFMRRKGQLVYPQLGLQLSVDDAQLLIGFSVLAESAILEQYVWEPGRRRRLPDEAWFVDTLGLPTGRSTDDEELMLEWTHGGLFIGADFSRDGRLTDVFVDYP